MTDSIDRLNTQCTECKTGTYQETTLQADWYGVLCCTRCGHQVKRHYTKASLKPKNEDV